MYSPIMRYNGAFHIYIILSVYLQYLEIFLNLDKNTMIFVFCSSYKFISYRGSNNSFENLHDKFSNHFNKIPTFIAFIFLKIIIILKEHQKTSTTDFWKLKGVKLVPYQCLKKRAPILCLYIILNSSRVNNAIFFIYKFHIRE